MTLLTLGFSADGIRANSIWPRYLVSTAATKRLEESGIIEGASSRGRDAREFCEALYALAMSDHSGKMFLDDEALPDMPPPPKGSPLDAFVSMQKGGK